MLIIFNLVWIPAYAGMTEKENKHANRASQRSPY